MKILAPGYYRLDLLAPGLAAEARPGQFIQVRAGDDGSLDPLLARPISLYRIDRNGGSVSMIFKAVGRGTAQLAAKQRGMLMKIWGPLGNGFAIPDAAQSLALVAGGVGMPPLFCLAEELRRARPGLRVELFYGGRTQRDLLVLEQWEAADIRVHSVTEDGSYGRKGLVTAVLEAQLRQKDYDFMVACGPTPMLKAVRQVALERGIAGQLSLESYMACGVGACLGCVCKHKAGYRRVCVDGPVFAMDEVDLE
ncbi:dihydroorotate dehydrogenase electron transfer subunit [Hydrogenispora ethanolica]|nr:dihydroorotate dehydrogenase electron transfer subunit [Hydrogenispora ethanolica]